MRSCFVVFSLLEAALATFQDVVNHQRELGWQPTASSHLNDIATRMLDSGTTASCGFRRIPCSESGIVETIKAAGANSEAIMIEGCSFEDSAFEQAALSERHQDAVIEARRIDVRLASAGTKTATYEEYRQPKKTTMAQLLQTLAGNSPDMPTKSMDAKSSHSEQYFDVAKGILLQGLRNPNSSSPLWRHLVSNYDDSIDSVQFDTDLPLHNHGRTWLYLHVGSKLWVASPPEAKPPVLAQWGMPLQSWMAQNVAQRAEQSSNPAEWLLRTEHLSGWKPVVCLQPPKSIVVLPQFWWHATASIGTTIGFGKQSNYDASSEVPESTPQALRDILALPEGFHAMAIQAPTEDQQQDVVERFERLWTFNKYDLKSFDNMMLQLAQLGGKNRFKKLHARAQQLIKEAVRLSAKSGGPLHVADARDVVNQIIDMVASLQERPISALWKKLLPKSLERLRKHSSSEEQLEL